VQDSIASKSELRGMAISGRVSRLSRLGWLLVAAAVGALAAGLWWVLAPVKLAATLPIKGDAAEVVYATGVVEPRYWAKVSALSRKRIVEMCQCEGQSVRKGDVLARLDDNEEKALLTELQARRDRLQQDAERMKPLVDRNYHVACERTTTS